MKTINLKNQRGVSHVIFVFLAVAVVATASFFVYQKSQEAKLANSTSNLSGPAKTASAPLVVKSVEFSTKLDSTGKALAPTASFAPTDGKINVVSTLQNPKKGTRIEFVRYRDGKFTDNGSLAIAKDGAQYASFAFAPKTGKQHPAGTYKVKIYANGKYQTTATYSVK